MLVSVSLVWTLFAFGGAFPRALLPAAVALLLAALLVRPRILSRPTRTLDAFLLLAVACPLVQIIPLPPGLRNLVSPAAARLDAQLRFDPSGAMRPLTLDFEATLKAAAVAAMAALVFWTMRSVFAEGGLRRTARTVAWSSLAVSVIGVLGRRWRSALVYGMFDVGASSPMGPFINRNHFGTWLVLALPMTIGYLFARFERHARDRGGMSGAVDGQTIWLAGAAVATGAALVTTLSRSATIGAVAVFVVLSLVALTRRHFVMSRYFTPVVIVVTAALALVVPATGDLLDRFQDSRTTETWARAEIWRETLPIVGDFPLTGVGLGAYRTAMLVYQQADRTFFFNQAHNQYLQFAAEGGLLLILPLGAATIAFVVTALRQERHDRSAAFWLRAGAIAGVAGVLVQSLWETGLRMPANAFLFAIVCALAVHERRSHNDLG